MKNSSTQRFDQGKIANAFGKILKLKEGPDKLRLCKFTLEIRQKCPKYMKILSAEIIPQAIILKGIMYNPARYFYFLGFRLE